MTPSHSQSYVTREMSHSHDFKTLFSMLEAIQSGEYEYVEGSVEGSSQMYFIRV